MMLAEKRLKASGVGVVWRVATSTWRDQESVQERERGSAQGGDVLLGLEVKTYCCSLTLEEIERAAYL